MELPINQHGVDNFSAIVHRHVAQELYFAGVTIDLHYGDMRSERKRKILRFKKVGGGKTGLHIWRQVFRDMGRESDILNAYALAIDFRFRQSSCGRLSVRD